MIGYKTVSISNYFLPIFSHFYNAFGLATVSSTAGSNGHPQKKIKSHIQILWREKSDANSNPIKKVDLKLEFFWPFSNHYNLSTVKKFMKIINLRERNMMESVMSQKNGLVQKIILGYEISLKNVVGNLSHMYNMRIFPVLSAQNLC